MSDGAAVIYNCVAWRDRGNVEIVDTRAFRRIQITSRGRVVLYPFAGANITLEGEAAAQVIPQLESLHPPIQSPQATAALAKKYAGKE